MLEKGIISKFDLNKMDRAELIEQMAKHALPLPPEFNKNDLIKLIGDARPPEVSREGIMNIARMIKYEADLGRGTGGAYDFLKMVYPDQPDEDVKRMARIIDVTRHDA